jgi:hypothetical protein
VRRAVGRCQLARKPGSRRAFRDDLKAEQKAAADILRAGAEHHPARADKAIDSRKDKDRRDI